MSGKRIVGVVVGLWAGFVRPYLILLLFEITQKPFTFAL